MAASDAALDPHFSYGVVADFAGLPTTAPLSGTTAQSLQEGPEAVRQKVLAGMQARYDAAIAAACAKYEAQFDAAYKAYPEVPRGMLEAIAFVRTDFQSETASAEPSGQTPTATGYGILGLTVDNSGYYRSNLTLVAQLSGYPADAIKQEPATELLAFASAYVTLKHRLGIQSDNPADHLPIIEALSDVPTGNQDLLAYARERYLYEILYVLNQSNYQAIFKSPSYYLNLAQVFGQDSYEALSSSAIVSDGTTVRPAQGSLYPDSAIIEPAQMSVGPAPMTVEATAACKTPAGLGVEHVQQTWSPVSWSPRVGAKQYVVRYKKVTDTNWQSVTYTPPNPQPDPIKTNITGLMPATQYEFQVQSVCSDPNVTPPVTSPFSPSFTFFTFDAGPICQEQGVNGCNYPNMQWDGNVCHLDRLEDVDLNGNGIRPELTDLRPCQWIQAIVIHVVDAKEDQPNSTYVGTIARWKKKPVPPDEPTAAHYLVSKVDGQIFRAYDERHIVSHTLNNSTYTVGIEHTGKVDIGGFSPAMYAQSAQLVKAIACRYGIDTKAMYAGPGTNYKGSKYELPYVVVPPLTSQRPKENKRTYATILGHGHTPNHGTHYDPGVNWDWFGYYQLVNADVISLPHVIPDSVDVFTQCTGKLSDDGGPNGNYSNNARRRWVIKPDCLRPGGLIRLSFSDFSTASGDWLYVYDGEVEADQNGNPAGHLIGAWSNWAASTNVNQSGPQYFGPQNGVDWGVPLINPNKYVSPQSFFKTYAGATNRAITVETIADVYGHERGFTATWEVINPPTTTLTVGDTCTLACCSIPSDLEVVDVTSSSAHFTWRPVAGAVNYSIRIRVAGSGDAAWRVRSSAEAERTLGGLERLTDYEVQVLSSCDAAGTSDWSYPVFFTTKDCVTPPTGLRQVSKEPDKMTIAWDSTGASTFRVEWKVSGRPDSEFDSQIVEGTSFTITKWRNEATLRGCTDYFVRVRAVCASGDTSEIYDTFRTSCPDDTPSGNCGLIRHCKGDPFRVLIDQYITQFDERHFSARWATAEKRSGWRTRYRECVHFPFDPPDVYTCLGYAYIIPSPNQKRHKPKCTDNKHWDYVLEDIPIDLRQGPIVLDFEISCDGGANWYQELHTLNDPDTTVSNLGPNGATITWQPVPGATGYTVTYGESEAETAIVMSTQSTTVPLSGLLTNTEYEVEVAAVLPSGSVKSPLVKFIPVAAGTCAMPQESSASRLTESSAALSWAIAPGAVGYNVMYAVSGTSDWSEVSAVGNHLTLNNLSPATNYKFKVQSVCDNSLSGYSSKATLTTAGSAPVGYCGSGGSQTNYEWINSVALGDLVNPSGPDGGYGEYTHLSANLAAGATYPVTLTPGFSATAFDEYWNVWIDFNGNGSFEDPAELVFSPGPGSSAATGTIAIPATARQGATRMRVAMKFNGYPSACGDLEEGEVEDYTVNISPQTSTAPVAVWKFDEGSGATAADSSGHNLNGTLTNGPLWTTGRSNTALSFDGVDDYVQVGVKPGLAMSSAMTMSAWVRPGGDGIIVNKEGEYEFALLGGHVNWAFANANPGWGWIDTGVIPSPGQWTHVAITYDNGTVKTYANGVLAHTYAGAGAIYSGGNEFRIGGRQCCPQFFTGRIDEVRVYDRALSASEVQRLVSADDFVWVEDGLPAGAVTAGDAEGWTWIGANPSPYSGTLAHQSNLVTGMHQHYFYGATNTLAVNAGEALVAYVYLDPLNPPSEIMLQWNEAATGWDHRAYWGANNIAWGVDGTNSRRYLGALPPAGQWVRLEIPASQVGLVGTTVYGMAFTMYGGRATWDHAGKFIQAQSAPPAAPGPLTATAVSSSQINLAWQDNSGDETGFKVERSADGGVTFSLLATVGVNVVSYQNTGLTPGTTYHYRVRATNGAGDSAPSNVASATTANAPPTVPGSLAATAVSSSQINLTWTGSSNHTGYILERSLSTGTGFTPIATLPASALSYPDTGLGASTRYYYRIKSTNGSTQSAYSNEATAITLSAPPAAPSGLTATAFSSSLIGITWLDNSNNETGFKIERSVNGVNFSQVAVMGANASSYTDSGLPASTTYYYRVRAYNGSGDSGYTNVASATTLAASPPAAPSFLAATAVSSSQVNLSWQDNSGNESGFVVERYSSGLGSWVSVGWPAANVTSFSDVGLPASTMFNYRVKAFSPGGDSAYSNVATATTLAGGDTPAAPSNLQATAISGTKVRLTWQDNSSNEWGFALERDAGMGFVQIQSFSANTTSYADLNLSPAATYAYRVRALTGAACCNSAYSNVANVTTPSYFSLAVNGSQWFQAPSSPSINVDSTSLTVEAWVKTDVNYLNCTTCPAQMIVSRLSPGVTSGINGGYELWINSGGKLVFNVYRNSITYGSVKSESGYSPIPIRAGQWHHVAGVYNSLDGTLSVYVDGIRTGSAPTAYAPRSGTSALMIGKATDPNTPLWFVGKIDEVRISAEAVYTGPGITDYYLLAHLPPRPGGTTKALWTFDGRNGNDTSGNSNTGFAQGGATYSPDVPDFTVARFLNPWGQPEVDGWQPDWLAAYFPGRRSDFIWVGG